jgi:hypothetical protein
MLTLTVFDGPVLHHTLFFEARASVPKEVEVAASAEDFASAPIFSMTS